MRTVYASAIAAVALAVGLLSAATTITGEVDPGVASDNPGGIVREVVPGGPAWSAGIRHGQTVLALHAAEEPGGWALETTDGHDVFQVTSAAANAPLRLAAVGPLLAIALALLALATVRSSRRESELLASLAIVLATAPVVVVVDMAAPVAVAAASVVPLVWLARWHSMPANVAIGLAMASASLGLVWTVGSLAGANPHGLVLVAWAAVLAASVAAMLIVGLRLTRARVVEGLRSVQVLDGVVVVGTALGAIALAAIGVPAPWTLTIWVVPLLAYGRARRALSAALDAILLTGPRAQAGVVAAEAERARLARNLHDDPLQVITGVIQQLERPSADAAAALDSLRGVAERLRDTTVRLYPAILDDLGLVPAIESVVRSSAGTIPIDVDMSDATGYVRSNRPPREVEHAAYRIAREAITNAVRHSQASCVKVTGEVSSWLVRLVVEDDGIGVLPDQAEVALRAGHLGLPSMRQQADIVDASLAIGRSPDGGCRVVMTWPA